jgi:hypothetical protein
MQEVQLLVTLKVEECEPDAKIDRGTMQKAALEAVENVLNHAQGVGFPHKWENELSIMVGNVRLAAT